MKNLGRTIDRIIKVDPSLESYLTPIKNKARRYPTKTMDYWQELLEFLNSEPLNTHPKREEFRNIITSKRKVSKQLYTFENVAANDKLVGVIPEHIADMIRRHDRKAVAHRKKQVEAEMTKNTVLMAQLSRSETFMEISMRKIWVMLKDHFNLWEKPISFTIKSNGSALVLIEQPLQPQGHMITPGGGMMRLGPDQIRGFFKMLGFDPSDPD